MNSKHKKSNILIMVLIVIIAGCGIMAAGTALGWFQKDTPTSAEENTAATETTTELETDSADGEEAADAEAGENDGTNSEEVQESSNGQICTITIICSSVLKNKDKLEEGKGKCVPPNGTILATSSIEFEEGNTVYDVLKRSCSAAGIPLSARNSSMGVYVEGINGLFEFDCGSTSGWMYSVNGTKPNHSCAEHKVNNGDKIVWSYTCGN